MDTYFGYSKTRMHKVDRYNTTFMMEHANHLYNIMPFGLENAGDT